MGHIQSTTEARLLPMTKETWLHVSRLNALQMNYSKAMITHQRFLERQELDRGVNSDFAQRKRDHEAQSKRLAQRAYRQAE